ncbi:MAG TPA: hypothetical protein VFF73_08965 [Planctomycetota bacterium]|nr:hypothetical protein [Planctomycetota bacterium]
MLKQKQSHVSAVGKKIADLKKGIQAVIPATATFPLNGVNVTQSDLLAQLTAREAPIDLVTQKRGELEAAINQRRSGDLDTRRFLAQVKAAIILYLGRTNPELTQFGLKPAKDTGTITSQEAQARAQKAKETRAKNGTLGKRQKQALDQQPGTTPPPAPKSA